MEILDKLLLSFGISAIILLIADLMFDAEGLGNLAGLCSLAFLVTVLIKIWS